MEKKNYELYIKCDLYTLFDSQVCDDNMAKVI